MDLKQNIPTFISFSEVITMNCLSAISVDGEGDMRLVLDWRPIIPGAQIRDETQMNTGEVDDVTMT